MKGFWIAWVLFILLVVRFNDDQPRIAESLQVIAAKYARSMK